MAVDGVGFTLMVSRRLGFSGDFGSWVLLLGTHGDALGLMIMHLDVVVEFGPKVVNLG